MNPTASQALGLAPSQTAASTTQVVLGTIGNPAPQNFGDLVMVLPRESPANGIGPMPWVKAQGATLPQYGNRCVVVFDEKNATVVWFDGGYSAPVYLPQTAPAAPATGFVLYCDQADSKLKAKAASGTVTTLASS